MSTADDIQSVRMNLGDFLTPAVDKEIGDGDTKAFVLTHKHVQDYYVYIGGVLKEETTDYTVDTNSGVVKFVTAPADEAEVKVEYNYAGFTDTDLTTLLTSEGSVNNATIKAVKMLMMDAARRFDYTHGDTEMSHSQVFTHLKDMLETFRTSDTPLIMNRTNEYYERETRTTDDLTRDDLGVDDE